MITETDYKVSELYSTDYSVSMPGCPVDNTDDIQVEPSFIDNSDCVTIRSSNSPWSIIPGKDICLYDLYIVIGTAVATVFCQIIRTYKQYFARVKSTFFVGKPCFLRL